MIKYWLKNQDTMVNKELLNYLALKPFLIKLINTSINCAKIKSN